MKKVLISIHPRWCAEIFNGQKTIEVRKSFPRQLETPFEVLVYCTKGKENEKMCFDRYSPYIGNGKVIGEFVCDRVEEYEGEFWDDDTYERIQEPWEPSDFAEYGEYEYDTIGENGEFYGKGIELSKQSCLSWNELRNYVGQGLKDFYCWHITEPKLFDKPKELSEFFVPCKKYNDSELHCMRWDCEHYSFFPGANGDAEEECLCKGRKPLRRPPQSWCYVEKLQ